jgi:hypothetical protein
LLIEKTWTRSVRAIQHSEISTQNFSGRGFETTSID